MTPWSGSARKRLIPSATTLSASMSSPESVSSRIAIFGLSNRSWSISCRFFSPPEKPSLRLRCANPGYLDGVLHREEQACPGPGVHAHREHVFAVQGDGSAGHQVLRMARDRVG